MRHVIYILVVVNLVYFSWNMLQNVPHQGEAHLVRRLLPNVRHLETVQEMEAKKERLRSTLVAALSYPVFLLFFSAVQPSMDSSLSPTSRMCISMRRSALVRSFLIMASTISSCVSTAFLEETTLSLPSTAFRIPSRLEVRRLACSLTTAVMDPTTMTRT